jgi:hypothetical protein
MTKPRAVGGAGGSSSLSAGAGVSASDVPGQVAAGRARVTPITKTELVPLAGGRGGILAHDAVAPVDLSMARPL